MHWNEYQDRVIGLLSPASTESSFTLTDNGVLGLSGEAGEVADIWKKVRYHGKELDRREIALELGDALFYVAETAKGLGYTLEEIANMNINKLNKRYPSGRFTVEDSIAKKDQQ